MCRTIFVTLTVLMAACSPSAEEAASQRFEARIPSSLDGTEQPAFVILPAGFSPEGKAVPLLVSLHTWSNDYKQRHEELERLAAQRGWIYLFPNFCGRNDNPDACGSAKARQDILDAIAWTKQNYPVDANRVYLTGSSGGGHMTLLMAARHPEVWAAASAFVPISDLAAWHTKHAGGNYGEMIRACTGGAPGDSTEVDREYKDRSPLTWLASAGGVPLDIAAGIRDGHEGSVPIRQTLDAFNAVAQAVGGNVVSEEEIEQLSAGPEARLASPRESDQVTDPAFGRAIYLRRGAGKARVTIFEGGHEGIPAAQVEWLGRFHKQ